MGTFLFWILWGAWAIWFAITTRKQRQRWVMNLGIFAGAVILVSGLIDFTQQGYLTVV
jgi:hypothetical protein